MMAGDSRPAVTVFGLGAMGSALAGAFLEGGYPTTVWNRSAGKADVLVARGALRAASLPDAVGASPLVVVCASDYAAAREILEPLDEVAVSGRALVNLTTGTPDQARRMAGWAVERGAAYLDGGILADPEQIGTPGARFYYSGSREAFEAHRRTLEVLGEDATYYGEDAGLASVYFMALIGLSYQIWIAYLDALALVGAENVDATAFAPSATGVLTPTVGLLEAFARAVDAGDHPPIAGPLSTHAALMDDLIDSWRARGIDVGRLEHVKSLVDRGVAEGHGSDGFSSLIGAVKERGRDV